MEALHGLATTLVIWLNMGNTASGMHFKQQQLHWLPVRQRITYKLCVLMHGVAFDYAPTYLRYAVVPLSTLPGRAHLRSVDSRQYDVPRVSTLAGSRAFSVAGPQAWNQLPPSLRNMDCIATFKRHLKTILFEAAYGVACLLYTSPSPRDGLLSRMPSSA